MTISNISKKLLCALAIVALPAGMVTLTSCDDDDNELKILPSDIKVTEVSVPETVNALSTATMTVQGKGFAAGDGISLTDANKKRYDAPVTEVTESSIAFGFPLDLPAKGAYTVRLHRGDDDFVLGNTNIELIYDFGIDDIAVPSTATVTPIKHFTVGGKGYLATDAITFAPVSGTTTGTHVEAATVEITATGITVEIPRELYRTGNAKFAVGLKRNGRIAELGSTTVTFALEAPERQGYSLRGVVSCNFKGLEGVVVSDGVDVTTTDADGLYYLNSTKPFGYVFISTPSGYEPATATGTNTPANFQHLTAAAQSPEEHNFELTAAAQNSYVLVTMADMHLANRNNDISQYEKGFLKDVNDLIKSYEAQGKKVYGLTLGDQSWDQYWYANSYAIPEAMKEVYKVKCPTYNVIGNHDNDPYVADNFGAQAKWNALVCPNYYSFNLGHVHYIVLDNIYYKNVGASQGVIGTREYTGTIDAVQLEWLRRDLATITDKTRPVAVCMHAALFTHPYLNSAGSIVQNVGLTSGADLIAALDGFTDVKVITGHSHLNARGSHGTNITEYNTAAVCATWWWTGKNNYAGNHICRDGAPGGYGVWEVSGNEMTQYYKSIGYDRNYQFRTTDLNQVHITLDKYAPNCTDPSIVAKFNTYAQGYQNVNDRNEVLINVFNWGPGWKVNVTENGKQLTAKQVTDRDPLHIISYEMMRLNQGGTTVPTDGFVTNTSVKIFKVTASSPTSTLEITVTDHFGNVYTQTMERPKAFNYTMQ